jgi:hypothetical protein
MMIRNPLFLAFMAAIMITAFVLGVNSTAEPAQAHESEYVGMWCDYEWPPEAYAVCMDNSYKEGPYTDSSGRSYYELIGVYGHHWLWVLPSDHYHETLLGVCYEGFPCESY